MYFCSLYMNNLGEIQRDPDIDLDIAVINNGFQSTFSRSTAMILFSVNKLSITDIFFFWQRGNGDICLTKPKDKESRRWIQFHLWWKLRFHLEKLLLYSDFFLYIIRCICCTVGCIRCTQNMSEIKVILVLSFLMHIYTQMLRVYVHNVIISAFQ